MGCGVIGPAAHLLSRKHGVVVWLDGEGHYTALVDRLAQARASGSLPYEVKAFRGSHLDLMLSLDGLASGAEKTPLLIHVPGFNEETIRQTPSLELYEAGVRYRKSLDTLVNEAASGRVRPDQIAAFQGEAELSLERADRWLAAALAGVDGGIGGQLRGMHPSAILDDLLSNGFIAQRVAQGQADAPLERLRVATGLTPEWSSAPCRRRSDVRLMSLSPARASEAVRARPTGTCARTPSARRCAASPAHLLDSGGDRDARRSAGRRSGWILFDSARSKRATARHILAMVVCVGCNRVWIGWSPIVLHVSTGTARADGQASC